DSGSGPDGKTSPSSERGAPGAALDRQVQMGGLEAGRGGVDANRTALGSRLQDRCTQPAERAALLRLVGLVTRGIAIADADDPAASLDPKGHLVVGRRHQTSFAIGDPD